MSVTPESIRVLLDSADLGDRLRAVNQIRTLPHPIAYELIQQAVNDSNPRVRYSAVSQLASLGNQDRGKTLELLRDRLQDSEPDVQAAAADSIGALQFTEVFDDLHTLYTTTPEWLVKFSIVAALGELGDNRSFAMLEDALQSPNELMVMAAIGSLGELGDPRAVHLLANYATHTDWQVRYRVVQAMARLQGPEARAVLEKLAQDEVEQVAQEAKAAIA